MDYKQIILAERNKLGEMHPYGRTIFGCALDGYEAIHSDTIDWDAFADALAWTLRAAKFWEWHESEYEVFERFCMLCAVDPYLVNVAFGGALCKK